MAETKRRIEIIDSGWASVALSLVAIVAAKRAKVGNSLHQVLHRVKKCIPCLRGLGVQGCPGTLIMALKEGEC